MSSRGRFATSADFPLQDCNPYRGLHVLRERLGAVHRSRPFSVAPCQTLIVRFATFFTTVSHHLLTALTISPLLWHRVGVGRRRQLAFVRLRHAALPRVALAGRAAAAHLRHRGRGGRDVQRERPRDDVARLHRRDAVASRPGRGALNWVTLRARWVTLRASLVTLRDRWVTLRARWVTLRARWVTLRACWVTLRASWVMLRARWVTLRDRCVTLRARWVRLRARWVTLKARWVTLSARWVTLRARWVTLRALAG
jgi:hypothetical protein